MIETLQEFERKCKHLQSKGKPQMHLVTAFFEQPIAEELLRFETVFSSISYVIETTMVNQGWDIIKKIDRLMKEHNPLLYPEFKYKLMFITVESYQFTKDKESLSYALNTIHDGMSEEETSWTGEDLFKEFVWQLGNFAPLIGIPHLLSKVEMTGDASEEHSGFQQIYEWTIWHKLLKEQGFDADPELFGENLALALGREKDHDSVMCFTAPLSRTEGQLLAIPIEDWSRNPTEFVKAATASCVYDLLQKGIPPVIGYALWSLMVRVDFEGGIGSMYDHITISTAAIRSSLELSMPSDGEVSKQVSILWGMPYLIDFLEASTLMNAEDAQLYQKRLQQYQDQHLGKYGTDMWRHKYLLDWEPRAEEDAERREELEYSLSQEGVLMSIVERVEKQIFDSLQHEERMLSEAFDSSFSSEEHLHGDVMNSVSTAGNLKKYGRNEKVDVKYADGRVLQQVKYKKVSLDVEQGLCTVLSDL